MRVNLRLLSVMLFATVVGASPATADDAWTREFSVYNHCYAEEISDAFGREFSVFVQCFEEVITDAFAREFSVYNRCYDEEITDAFAREFSVYNHCYDEEISDAFAREFSVYNRCYDEEITDAFAREFSVYNHCYDEEISDAFSREFSVYLPQPLLRMTVQPGSGGTTIPAGCTAGHGVGEAIDIIALAAPGYDFDHWQSDGNGVFGDPGVPCTTFTITADATVTAVFVLRSTITVTWIGDGDGVSWSDARNWCPPIVPDETGPANFHAVIDGADVVVQLDMSPTVTRLDVLNGATLQVDAATGSQVLTVSERIRNAGYLQAEGGAVLRIETPEIVQTEGGWIRSFNTGTLVQIVDAVVRNGFIFTAFGGQVDLLGSAQLIDVVVSELVVPDTEIVNLDGNAINLNFIFVDGQTAETRLGANSDLALSAFTPDAAQLVLGHADYAFAGAPDAALTQEAGHRIVGAGSIQGSMFTNRGVVLAAPAPAPFPATIGETLRLQAPCTNEGSFIAADGFILDLAASMDQTAAGTISAVAGGTVYVNSAITGWGSLLANEGGVLYVSQSVNAYTLIVTGGSVFVDSSILACENGVDLPPGFGSAAAALNLSAGTLNCHDGVFVGDGIIMLEGGSSLTATRGPVVLCPDTAADPDAVAELHVVDAGSTVTATSLEMCAGATLAVSGVLSLSEELLFTNTVDTEWSWGATSSLVITGGVGLPDDDPTDYARLEIGGADLGDDPTTHQGNPEGFIGNFHLNELVIGPGAHVQLVDNVVNAGSGLPEALYVKTLSFADSSGRLDLNGLHLYYEFIDPPGGESQIINCVPGDTVCDGDVDLQDFAALQVCFGVVPLPPECRRCDLNGDGTVDVADYLMFTAVMSGP